MRNTVYVVQHLHVMNDGSEDVKLIGVYSSHNAANEAVTRALRRPGFKEVPDGFTVDVYTLDEDNWIDGYVSG